MKQDSPALKAYHFHCKAVAAMLDSLVARISCPLRPLLYSSGLYCLGHGLAPGSAVLVALGSLLVEANCIPLVLENDFHYLFCSPNAIRSDGIALRFVPLSHFCIYPPWDG